MLVPLHVRSPPLTPAAAEFLDALHCCGCCCSPQVFGSSFSTCGLGGVLTCGVSGVAAGLSHSPVSRVSTGGGRVEVLVVM